MQTTWTCGEHDGKMPRPVWEYLTVSDAAIDNVFLPYEIKATQAHTAALVHAGVLTKRDRVRLETALKALLREARAGRAVVTADAEDCHTFVELHLTKRLGALGRKIQTGRSRNEQALTMIRLYLRDKSSAIRTEVQALKKGLRALAKKHRHVRMPGYTHSQRAMPVSVATYFESFRDSLTDDMLLLDRTMLVLNQSPGGSAAGFGLPSPWPKEVVRRELGFRKVQKNPVYCQASRGKFERMFIFCLENLAATVCRLACDLVMFTMQEFGFFSLPAGFTTGSSLMPHKRNYDVFELARASRATIAAAGMESGLHGFNLVSGYHRDLQRTKGPLVKAVEEMLSLLTVLRLALGRLAVNEDRMRSAVTSEMHSTADALALAMSGVPFRDAYQRIKGNLLPQKPPLAPPRATRRTRHRRS
ncbi:MAG: lyase family protein [Planctomycetota bacterium]|nr:lyase family protein [Planctomycetota bacterium]